MYWKAIIATSGTRTLILFVTLITCVHAAKYTYNITVLVQRLLEGYNKRVIPSEAGEPVNVQAAIYVYHMFPRSEKPSHEYTMDFFYRLSWRDYRLAYKHLIPEGKGNMDTITLSENTLDQLWIPDVYLGNYLAGDNVKITTKNFMLKLYPNGNIYLSKRALMTFYCRMELQHFPFDHQECKLEVFTYAYSRNYLRLSWLRKNGTFEANKMQAVSGPIYKAMLTFTFEGFNFYETIRKNHFQEEQDVLVVDLKLARKVNFYILNSFLPSFLIVILSWVGFWIDYRSVPARVALGIVTVLSMITLGNSVKSVSPSTTNSTFLDWYLLVCFLFVFMGIVEFAIVNMTDKYWRARQTEREETSKHHNKSNISQNPSRRQSSFSLKSFNENHDINKTKLKNSLKTVEKERDGMKQRLSVDPVLSGIALQELNRVSEASKERRNRLAAKTINKWKQSLYEKHKYRKEEIHVLDRVARIGFPMGFLIFNVAFIITVYYQSYHDHH